MKIQKDRLMKGEYKNIIVKVTPDQTLSKVVERLNEIKAEDLRPWVSM